MLVWASAEFEGDEDPWTKRAQEKKERVEKNKKNAERNAREAMKAEGKPLPCTSSVAG